MIRSDLKRTSLWVDNPGIRGFLLLLFLLVALRWTVSFFGPGDPHGAFYEGDLYLEVSGDIRHPGVYSFPDATGLKELIERGGGLTGHTGLPEGWDNVALRPGTLVIVTRDATGWSYTLRGISAFHKLTLGVPLSLNLESEEGLTALPGVGPRLAETIVKERRARGEFTTLEEMKSIKGIGDKLFRKIVPYLTL